MPVGYYDMWQCILCSFIKTILKTHCATEKIFAACAIKQTAKQNADSLFLVTQHTRHTSRESLKVNIR